MEDEEKKKGRRRWGSVGCECGVMVVDAKKYDVWMEEIGEEDAMEWGGNGQVRRN